MSALASSGSSPSAARTGRRFSAIVFADVVGYTALVAADEGGALARWQGVLGRVIHPEAERHHGTIVQVMGDGVLAEFPSALDAFDWARAVQRHLAAGADAEDAPQPLAMRIAVHCGEVVSYSGGLFGEAVNIAARLQEHAETGGIVLSEAAHDLLRPAFALETHDLGPLRLKNVPRPVRAYAVPPEPGTVALMPSRPSEAMLPCVAVMPLQNLSGDPADDYFADGIVEDIVVSLAGLHELMVISRASTLAWRGRHADPREVGRVLGARYVLLGSVRRAGATVRIGTQLCDAETGASLWSDRADAARDALFEVQDEIVGRVVAGLSPQVRAAELKRALRKRPDSFTAYDCLLRGLDVLGRMDRATFPQARDFFARAMAEDPDFAAPAAWSGWWHVRNVGQGWSTDREADRARGNEHAARAVELDGRNAVALATLGHLKSYLLHDYGSALMYLNRALVAGPSNALAWALSSASLSYVGHSSRAVGHAEHALRLSPFDPALSLFHNILGIAHYAAGDHEKAVRFLRLADDANAPFSANLRYLIGALMALGRRDEAAEAAARLLRLEPDFRLSEFERTRLAFRAPDLRADHMARLRAAGLPE